ncbi:uncharacterized protein LOC116213303 [Punica granatum]|uniref:Uncharacterized protein LOC116213303 n=1 Tax=Punica granatum TaxID=22663 RepID=A0A218WPV7_PUNGR|nr:uncharacterized protein LOC116213303 [Punica granatum]OWM74845.1 hypothetical protein CDL15_Pgr004612 [Punica granatum]
MPRLYLPRPSPLPLSSAQSPPSSLVPPMADTIGDHFKAELKFTNVWEGIPRNPLLPFTSSVKDLDGNREDVHCQDNGHAVGLDSWSLLILLLQRELSSRSMSLRNLPRSSQNSDSGFLNLKRPSAFVRVV